MNESVDATSNKEKEKLGDQSQIFDALKICGWASPPFARIRMHRERSRGNRNRSSDTKINRINVE